MIVPSHECVGASFIGDQTVYYASSEDMSAVPSESVDFIVTSPPYWNLKRYGSAPGEIGQESYECYLQRLATVLSECYRVAKMDSILVVNINSRRSNKQFYPLAFDLAGAVQDWRLWDVMIWYIPNALPQPNHYMNRLFDNKFEYLLVFVKGEPDGYTFHKPRVPQKYLSADPRSHKRNADGRCIGNVIRIPAYRPPTVKQMAYHVAAYPEELAALLLETYTDPGDTVLDPFLGSGTTLKVAKHMERRGIGFELNQDFRQVIEDRIHEPWEVPDWRSIDILHSATATPGMQKPRKVQYQRQDATPSLPLDEG